jgi:hypothetical protein
MKGVLAMVQGSKAGSSDALDIHDKPGIRRLAIWLLCGQVNPLAGADRLPQQCSSNCSLTFPRILMTLCVNIRTLHLFSP